jgi:hypothetical protein
MCGVYPFEEQNGFQLAASIVVRRIKEVPKESEGYYSKKLKFLLDILLSQVYVFLIILDFVFFL